MTHCHGVSHRPIGMAGFPRWIYRRAGRPPQGGFRPSQPWSVRGPQPCRIARSQYARQPRSISRFPLRLPGFSRPRPGVQFEVKLKGVSFDDCVIVFRRAVWFQRATEKLAESRASCRVLGPGIAEESKLTIRINGLRTFESCFEKV